MSFPTVTVILTVFKRETFIHTAIRSVLAQTFAGYEIIVTDDSNKSSIRQICDSFQAGDCLRYRSNASQLGAPLNILAAIQEAKGKYIAILNDDDYWETTFLEKLVAPLEENPERVIAFSDHWIVRDDGSMDSAETDLNTMRYGRKTLLRGEIPDPASLVLKQNGVPLAMASLFRKDALDLALLTKEVVGAYDFWIACALAATGKPFYYVPERLTHYRLHVQMETGRRAPDKNLPMIFIFDQMLARNWFPAFKKFVQQRLAEAYFRNGRDLLWFNHTGPARQMFWQALQVYWLPKAMVAWGLSFIPHFIRRSARLSQLV